MWVRVSNDFPSFTSVEVGAQLRFSAIIILEQAAYDDPHVTSRKQPLNSTIRIWDRCSVYRLLISKVYPKSLELQPQNKCRRCLTFKLTTCKRILPPSPETDYKYYEENNYEIHISQKIKEHRLFYRLRFFSRAYKVSDYWHPEHSIFSVRRCA